MKIDLRPFEDRWRVGADGAIEFDGITQPERLAAGYGAPHVRRTYNYVEFESIQLQLLSGWPIDVAPPLPLDTTLLVTTCTSPFSSSIAINFYIFSIF